MRIATYRTQTRIEVGVLSQDGSAITPFDIPPDRAAGGLLALLGVDQTLLPLRDVDHPLNSSEVELLAPIPRPRRNILCVGKNYYAHVQEIANAGFDSTGGGAEAPKVPIIFSKLPECVIATGASIQHDLRVTKELDYEAELAVIIGRKGRSIPQVDAMDYVWGYTIINDVTARDLQKNHKQWLLGKSQDTFCPMGPFAITRDLLDLRDTSIRCWVNGELRQDGNTGQLMFGIPALIESISAGVTLYPGDVIATGTPAGVGAGFDPPRFLQAGDEVRIEIPPIGVLENPVRRWDGR
ncbi:MAG: fumarylacetoacetate hydrolase family protein [Gammaproteobacteria bacterium]|nr:fumarylacetoacetate hydrolase family protein [Gammaproteobacteria bacterium]